MIKKIRVFSDTHGNEDWYKSLNSDKDVSLVIHCGDLNLGNEYEHIEGLILKDLYPNAETILVPGNNDIIENSTITPAGFDKILYNDSYQTFNGLKIHGCAFWETFDSWSYSMQEGLERIETDPRKLKEIYSAIPERLDILITHCPPYGILDMGPDQVNKLYNFYKHLGSPCLAAILNNMSREQKPKYHFFGHIHSCGGRMEYSNGTLNVNASVMSENKNGLNPLIEPIII